MTETRQWLEDYARTGSEHAFSEIVTHYLDLTYSTALRLVDGNAAQAQDVVQAVFIDLARLAPSLPRQVMLGGWLHRHTCFVAWNLLRAERRRRAREKAALDMNTLHPDSPPAFAEIAPLLDQAINRLNTADRTAIVLRFFEQKEFRAIAQLLGTSENTARMRVNRALEKLGRLLQRQGISCSAAALGAVLTTKAVAAAPAGIAAGIAAAAVLKASTAGGLTLTVLKFMGLTKIQAGAAAVALTVLTTALFVQHGREANLRDQNAELSRQLKSLESEIEAARLARLQIAAIKLPTPPTQSFVAIDPAPESLPLTNVYERLRNTPSKLTRQQLEPYLQQNRRNAAGLLAAYRTSGDAALLEEAMQSFPNDPQVAFEAVLKKNLTPEEQRKWLDQFKQTDPSNALPNYLSALDHFKSGRRDEAVQEFLAASERSFRDYTSERYQDDAEAYLAAGYSVVDAKSVASSQLLLPHLIQLKELGYDMINLSKSYRQAGDASSAQASLQMLIDLGQRYSVQAPGEPAISQLVGIALENMALKAMDPVSAYGQGGQTVADRINELTGQRNELQALYQKAEVLFPKLSESDWINYRDRWLTFGENNAVRWVIHKYGQL